MLLHKGVELRTRNRYVKGSRDYPLSSDLVVPIFDLILRSKPLQRVNS